MKVLIADPDPRAVALSRDACGSLFGSQELDIATLNAPNKAEGTLAESPADLLILDPQGMEEAAFERLIRLMDRRTTTILVSEQTDLAIKAFEFGVADFVPKPAQEGRIRQALERAMGAAGPARAQARVLAVRRKGRIELVPVEELLYAEGADKYSELVLTNGQRSFYDKGLSRLEYSLPESFVRIHKSFLVRFAMVSRLRVLRGSRYFAELKNGLRLPVGRSRYGLLKERLV